MKSQLSKQVSVPYWGSLSSNGLKMKIGDKIIYGFPSPTGVLYLLIEVIDMKGNPGQKFPSPTGVLYLLIIQDLSLLYVGVVSVPYWGSLSSNQKESI